MKYGDTFYLVWWYRFKPDEDTLEKMKHLPQSEKMGYCKRKKIEISDHIGKTNDG